VTGALALYLYALGGWLAVGLLLLPALWVLVKVEDWLADRRQRRTTR